VTTGNQKEYRDATAQLVKMVQDHRQGQAVGIFSICSANRFVLEAGMLQASRDHSLLCIESTSNQVNQFGGYTGQTPVDFAAFVRSVATAMKFSAERILLGGDHLGPHVWRLETSREAMAKARELVRSCVAAGYTKIHLDTSMRCADDAGDPHSPLADEIVCDRAADLCKTAEEAHQQLPAGSPAPVYVVGTEVPIPGGEQSESQAPAVTRTEDLERTLRLGRQAFLSRGLQAAWQRVLAVVVQPGVEFGDASVFAYDGKSAHHLSQYALEHWQGVYEAHSTDYQSPQALSQMVRDHFAILKVGPWLTFAFREAVFALAAIEEEWLSSKKGLTISHVREVLDQAMIENPAHWRGYFQGDENALRLARKFSYSDRSRYYWPQPSVAAALQRLIDNLSAHPAPSSVISQYLPSQCARIRAGTLSNHPIDLIRSKILEVIDLYAAACGTPGA
jgi:D-tagatose-1,6-bisphosphate aldolase subunit GatZ/KbaZ